MAVGGAGRRPRAHRAAGRVAVGYTLRYGRAKRGAGGSLNLQSAIAGLNSGSRRVGSQDPPRTRPCGSSGLTQRRDGEPRQVRKEATVSRFPVCRKPPGGSGRRRDALPSAVDSQCATATCPANRAAPPPKSGSGTRSPPPATAWAARASLAARTPPSHPASGARRTRARG
jgi:hypothetical protein